MRKERDRERERDRPTDRQADRQAEKDRERDRHRQTRERDRQTDTARQTEYNKILLLPLKREGCFCQGFHCAVCGATKPVVCVCGPVLFLRSVYTCVKLAHCYVQPTGELQYNFVHVEHVLSILDCYRPVSFSII